MLDIGWSELLVIAVVAIVVVGPKDLPPMLRALGRTVSKMRKMAGEFQGQFNEALKEAELDDVKKSFDELRGLNPMNDIKNSLNPLSGPIAKPAPAPVPPPADQPLQPATASDIEPAAPGPVLAEPAAEPVAVKPKRPRKTAAVENGEVAPAKPRASRAKAKPAANGTDAEAAPVKRVRKPKPAPAPVEVAAPVEVVTAPPSVASEPVVASVTEEPKT